MAGAFALGDFAWAHEDMLNKVLAGHIPADDRLSKQVKLAIDELHSRLAFYHQAQQKDARIEHIIARAQAIMHGEPEPIIYHSTTQSAAQPVTANAAEQTQTIKPVSAPLNRYQQKYQRLLPLLMRNS